EAGFRRHVLKGAVTLLMQQAVVIGGIRLLQFRQAGPVGEEDIQTAVVIVIEDSDSAAHRLWKILAFFEAVVAFIRDFRAWSDIHKSWPLGGCRGTSCHQSQGQEHASASENKNARALQTRLPMADSGRLIDSVRRDMKSLAFIVAGLSTVLAGAVAGPIMFEEIAQRAGLAFTTNSCPTPNKNQPETMVAGVGLLDYDNDGYLDVYFVNGAAIPSLKKEGPQYWNRLFHNNRDGTFTDVTEKAGVAGEGYGMGVAVGDFDNDGWPDIFVANVTKNQLFHNNHDGTFTDVTDKAGVGGGVLDGKKMWSVSAVWLDYNNDGLL